jgi:hypothetical protein
MAMDQLVYGVLPIPHVSLMQAGYMHARFTFLIHIGTYPSRYITHMSSITHVGTEVSIRLSMVCYIEY